MPGLPIAQLTILLQKHTYLNGAVWWEFCIQFCMSQWTRFTKTELLVISKRNNNNFKDFYDLKALSQESENSSRVIPCAAWVLEKMSFIFLNTVQHILLTSDALSRFSDTGRWRERSPSQQPRGAKIKNPPRLIGERPAAGERSCDRDKGCESAAEGSRSCLKCQSLFSK